MAGRTVEKQLWDLMSELERKTRYEESSEAEKEALKKRISELENKRLKGKRKISKKRYEQQESLFDFV